MTHTLYTKKALEKKHTELLKKTYLPVALVDLTVTITAIITEHVDNVTINVQNSPFESITTTIPTQEARGQGAVLLPRHQCIFDRQVAGFVAEKALLATAKLMPEIGAEVEELLCNFSNSSTWLINACEEAILLPNGANELDSSQQIESTFFAQWEQNHPNAPGLLRFIAQCAVMPSTFFIGKQLAPRHTLSTYLQGHCPICGSLPFMGRLKGAEGARHHTCSFCGFEFRVPRLSCPFCLDEQAEASEFIISDDDEAYQLHHCKKCNYYIKIADFREYDRQYLPMLDDLGSLLLDLHAKQAGYIRPTVSAWGF